MKNNEWYIKAFDKWYPIVYQHRDEKEAQAQVDFAIAELNLTNKSKVLDLCCGYGRHLKFLKNKVFLAIGFDLSLYLLREAQSLILQKSLLVRGDVRNLPFASNSFDAILNFFTSFGYFEEDSENIEQLKQGVFVLKEGGKYFFDYFNPIQVQNLKNFETVRTFKSYIIKETRWYDKEKKVLNKKVFIRQTDTYQAKSYMEIVRVYSLDELLDIFLSCNLRVKKIYGNYEGEIYQSESPRLIIIGEKNE